MRRGNAQMAKKDYARAILEFRSAAQARPADAEPYYQLGLAYLGMRNAGSAGTAFRQATQLNPKHSGAQLKLAELMAVTRNKGLVEQAASRLHDIIAASPDNLEAIDTLVLTELELGKPEDAAKRLEESLQKFPAHLASSVSLARIKLGRKDSAGAEEVLKNAVATAPQSFPAALALGQFYLALGQPEKAEPEVRKALQLDPKSTGALSALGAIQLQGKRLGEAEQTYRQLAAAPQKSYKPIHAMFLYRTGKIDAAVTELQGLAKRDLDDRVVRSTLLFVYLQLNRTKDAQELLAAVLKQNPKDLDALLQRGELYRKQGKFAEADQDLQQVLRLKPDSAAAHFAMAGAYKAEGLDKLENQELSNVLRLRPDLLRARLALVRNLVLKDQAKPALELLDRAPASQKRTLAVVTARIWALLEEGDSKDARTIMDQALRVARAPELVLQEAILKLKQHDYIGARLDAEEALRADPGDVRAARIVVSAYLGQNEQSKALDRLSEIVAVRPKSAALQNLLGKSYASTGRLDEARKAFEAANAADPTYLPAELALAEIDLQQNRADAGRRRLDAIVAANPKNVSALLMQAGTKSAGGDRGGSISAYRSVLAVDSSNLIALNNLAFELAADNPNEALKFAQQAGELAPDNANVQDTLGWVYYREGSYTTAITYLKLAVAKEATPRRQFHLAACYLKAGQRELGQKLLSAALEKDPNLFKTERGW